MKFHLQIVLILFDNLKQVIPQQLSIKSIIIFRKKFIYLIITSKCPLCINIKYEIRLKLNSP